MSALCFGATGRSGVMTFTRGERELRGRIRTEHESVGRMKVAGMRSLSVLAEERSRRHAATPDATGELRPCPTVLPSPRGAALG
jgi:hypothetical protein